MRGHWQVRPHEAGLMLTKARKAPAPLPKIDHAIPAAFIVSRTEAVLPVSSFYFFSFTRSLLILVRGSCSSSWLRLH